MDIDRQLDRRWWVAVVSLTALALVMRLLVWRWRELYPLGGDEAEYLAQAITLLQERRYVELRLMRPPLYPLFLAATIVVVDSLVQNLRLVQALISTLTVPLIALLARTLAQRSAPQMPTSFARRAGLLAGLLTAFNYTLAANATELLTETLFLAGLSLLFWLVIRPALSYRLALIAGLILGALCLIRSVALPLLPLTMGWWLVNAIRAEHVRRGLGHAAMILLGCALVIGPWTVRNMLTYGGVILIDTTGAENLWLDNDPAGREAVKAQLYALGEDRLLRQRLATERGIAVITADPSRFIAKMSRELRLFFALEQVDDMRARPAIWVSPGELVARLVVGDGVWLLILLTGGYGLVRRWQPASATAEGFWRSRWCIFADPRWLLGAWAAYVLLTTLIFHVELRYRIPLYPVLLAYSGMVGAAQWPIPSRTLPRSQPVALLVPTLALAITLWHAPYPWLGWQLVGKHWLLRQAEQALERGDSRTAAAAAQQALHRDQQSVLARVALVRAALLDGDQPTALRWLDEAIAVLPAHPYPHLLRGDLLRQQGDLAAARAELTTFATASREDLATWLWERSITPPPTVLNLGDGLDLGFIRGMHHPAANEQGWRWTTGWAQVRLTVPTGAESIALTMRSGRPDGTPVRVWITVANGAQYSFVVGADWQTFTVPFVSRDQPRTVVVSITSPTFWPRTYDPASPDGRRLGVQVRQVAVR
ncbi:glycosyltransferase family 39 protein [Chloroflexus aggregans]|uniref:Tetratricopeptide TPR_4 n=1 Tax=Chloroflexus aggregans (strain MD-66 / DSM 9485) TaxID=326427 RepID=B8G5I5_CHLAD|nr:glycosyltransferase family 39 protein [Chloroflexus aggregans]ACL25691.1 Tetratricopeptide TPR_4 [Chloroflexus aggregans DSM 9485]